MDIFVRKHIFVNIQLLVHWRKKKKLNGDDFSTSFFVHQSSSDLFPLSFTAHVSCADSTIIASDVMKLILSDDCCSQKGFFNNFFSSLCLQDVFILPKFSLSCGAFFNSLSHLCSPFKLSISKSYLINHLDSCWQFEDLFPFFCPLSPFTDSVEF